MKSKFFKFTLSPAFHGYGMLQVIKESTFLFLAFGVGLITFRRLVPFYRLIFSQVVLAVVIYLVSYGVTLYQREHRLPLNNQWLFNIYILLETTLLMGAAVLVARNKREQGIVAGGFIFFLLVFFGQMIVTGIWRFANYALIIEGVLVVIVYLVILYRQFTSPGFHWKTSPSLWLCLGTVTYFACNVPFISMIHYIQQYSPKLNEMLFHFITDILGNLRYALVALSFWLFARRYANTQSTV